MSIALMPVCRLKEYPLAIADYTAAIELYPTRLLYQRRAEAKRALGDAAGAEADQNARVGNGTACADPHGAGLCFGSHRHVLARAEADSARG